jgi:hypothetical protein
VLCPGHVVGGGEGVDGVLDPLQHQLHTGAALAELGGVEGLEGRDVGVGLAQLGLKGTVYTQVTDCTAARLQTCRLHGYMAAWLHGYRQIAGYMATWLQIAGYLATWLQAGYMATWLQIAGYMASSRLHGYKQIAGYRSTGH